MELAGKEKATSDRNAMLYCPACVSSSLSVPPHKRATLIEHSLTFPSSTIGTSISTSAIAQLMEEFHVSRVVATLTLSLFVLALAVGPILGGPLSETVGRYPVYLCAVPSGALFALGAGFTHNFGALCLLRFMSGLCWSPTLSVAAGSLSDLFSPSTRSLPSSIFLLLCFLGPGIGYESCLDSSHLETEGIRPVAGSFTVVRHGWRWTQWILALMAIPSFALTVLTRETLHPKIQRGLGRKHIDGGALQPKAPIVHRLRMFMVVGLVRPIRMLLFEPIVGFICLYVAVEFGTLFSFFAGIPYAFREIYGFSLEQCGLVFISVIIGCFLGLVTILLCDILIYRKQIPKYPHHQVPPEHRLYGAMIASVGLPLGLFWYAWTARPSICWASPAAAIIPFAWGNLCLFVSTIQYISDTYRPDLVASAASANSLARYGFAGVFPLFTIQSTSFRRRPLQYDVLTLVQCLRESA